MANKSDGKVRDPGLPPMRVTGFGFAEGEACGVVRGQGPPCPEKLAVERGDRDQVPRCRLHCREECRNADSLSLLCPVYRMRGRRKCAKHGGKSLVGPLAPGYLDGRASRWGPHAPKRYARLVESVAAGDALDLGDDIHMMSARIAELFEGMGDPAEQEATGKRLARIVGKLAALKSMPEDGHRLLSDARELLETAESDRQAWSEVRVMFRERTKMVETQRKGDLQSGKYVTAEDMVGMVRNMGLALKRRVEEFLDKDTGLKLLAAVSQDLAAIQGVDDQPEREEDAA
jgi:hypothetical protein